MTDMVAGDAIAMVAAVAAEGAVRAAEEAVAVVLAAALAVSAVAVVAVVDSMRWNAIPRCLAVRWPKGATAGC
jgi:hypothetical protein